MLCLSKPGFTPFIIISMNFCSSEEYGWISLLVWPLWNVLPVFWTAHEMSPLEYGYPIQSNILFSSAYVSFTKFSYLTNRTGYSLNLSHFFTWDLHKRDRDLTHEFQASAARKREEHYDYNYICSHIYTWFKIYFNLEWCVIYESTL